MNTYTFSRKSANEKSIEELQQDTLRWETMFQTITDEFLFHKQLLTGNVFESNVPNLYENLQEFYTELDDLRVEKIDLHEQLRNHKNDLNGMMECEDISCESFYYTQHQKLADNIRHHLAKFEKLELNIFRYTTPLLKRNS